MVVMGIQTVKEVEEVGKEAQIASVGEVEKELRVQEVITAGLGGKVNVTRKIMFGSSSSVVPLLVNLI
jgi:hypothetical protein